MSGNAAGFRGRASGIQREDLLRHACGELHIFRPPLPRIARLPDGPQIRIGATAHRLAVFGGAAGERRIAALQIEQMSKVRALEPEGLVALHG
jgi:hypothetical protein